MILTLANALATPPPPIDVRVMPKVEMADSMWSTIAAIASVVAALMSAGVAVATYILARDTSALAKVTRAAVEAEERRYKDAFRPHLALALVEVPQSTDGTENALVVEMKTKLLIKNVGSGPAHRITVHQKPATPPALEEIPPIAMLSGETATPALNSNVELSMIKELWVTYDDTFGSVFESRFVGELAIGTTYACQRL